MNLALLMPLALCAVALICLVPVLVLFAQVIAAARAPRIAPSGSRRPRVAVLMPAHDEASVIVPTLRRVMPGLLPGDRVLVVADNCSDDTAALAAAAGATVVERRDPARRGKNYALEFGVHHLAADAPEVVVVIDADCHVEDGAIDRLARVCAATRRPVQALYLMLAPGGGAASGRVAAFAWIVKNWVRPLGMLRLGLPCQLMGTGTAFPWGAVAGFPIANVEMAEDYKFGIDLALSGYPAIFCPDARVTSEFPVGKGATRTQRTRWEHGHLQLILRETPRLVAQAAVRRDMHLLGLAVDLVVPPLALLALALGAILAATLALAALGGPAWPLVPATAGAALFAVTIVLAWRGWGRSTVSLGSMLSAPGYALSKLPLYLRFITRRQRVWIKTGRD